ncbi:DUF2589 domain-containing protein [Pseudoalteromonas luteoviolacea]|uniref:DUF2589 domain-containing protein n=1 Tax=Pseudoalteromonas luteoviolacea DSM 6061 TaxID=1365250 RepID=A0A166WCM1_9GAMM|nr:DUF2589 domain-containing protein [Pseudoalteromonas luteoviolacea]KZN37140.1 hypothetical protein N475_17130 [Pseudoalteromonas luteoviolacea DSM 6061]MBE0389529.1 hypothetical protein [Pseudoalteromonas luteoviolacea DSM 6061]
MNTNIASQFSGLPMKALIGAPLKAATDANAMIANAQTQFLLTTCFEKSTDDNNQLVPTMVNFTLSRSVIDKNGSVSSSPVKMDISIPLMTLIPINSLAIERLKVSFNMEVKSSREINKVDSFDQQGSNVSKVRKAPERARGRSQGRLHGRKQRTAQNANEQLTKPSQAHEFETELHGSLAKSSQGELQQSSAAHASYEVTLEAGQLPLPNGITTILDIFSKNMMPLPSKN